MTLREFFAQHPRAALAFSGGADSACLLYAGMQWAQSLGVYCVQSPFQPRWELEDARRLAEELGAKLTVLEADPLSDPRVAANPATRCYYCKQTIMSTIQAAAGRDGFELILDGTNASDDLSDRPGSKALAEAGVLSPLRLCGMTKAQVRAFSREAGLFTWSKPAYACLATRIPAGEAITAEKLERIEKSEDALFRMGFTDFRVRTSGGRAKLQFTAAQHGQAAQRMEEIRAALSPYYSEVSLDPIPREESL